MRAGPLSQDNVIKMLNTQFVPVFVANAEHQGKGSASAEDKEAYARFRQTLDRDGYKYADVAFYVLKPTGEPYESLDINTSLDKTNFAQFLKVCTDTMEVRPGPVVLPVKPQFLRRSVEDELEWQQNKAFVFESGDSREKKG